MIGATRLWRLVQPRLTGFLSDTDNLVIAASSLAGFAIRVAGVVLMTVVTILFTRTMGAEEYGRLAFLLSGGFIIVLFAGLGLPTAASRLVPRYFARGDHDTAFHYFFAGLAFIAITATASAVAFATLMKLLPSVFGDYDFRLLGIVGLVSTLALMRFVSEGSRAFGYQLIGFVAESIAVRLLLLAALASYLSSGAVLSAGVALEIYVVAQAVVVLSVILIILFRAGLRPAALRLRPLRLYKGWLGISSVMLVTPVYYFLLFETDIVVLGLLAGPYEVGLYQVARRLAELTVFCAGAASSVGLPRLARAHAERRTDKLQATVNIMNLISVSSTALITLGLIVIGPLALDLFGRDFANGFPVLLILALGRFAAAFLGPVSDVLLMTGHHRQLGRINLGFAVVNLLLNLALVPLLGAAGAAIATSIASLSWNLWLYLLIRRLTPVDTFVVYRLWRRRRSITGKATGATG